MRWFILILGLVAAIVAGFALLTGPGGDSSVLTPAKLDPPHAHGKEDEIDEESRERLREILRSADNEEDAGR
jgi:hypothetical protein